MFRKRHRNPDWRELLAAIDDLTAAVAVLQGVVPNVVTEIAAGKTAEAAVAANDGAIATAAAAINAASQNLNDALGVAPGGVPTSS